MTAEIYPQRFPEQALDIHAKLNKNAPRISKYMGNAMEVLQQWRDESIPTLQKQTSPFLKKTIEYIDGLPDLPDHIRTALTKNLQNYQKDIEQADEKKFQPGNLMASVVREINWTNDQMRDIANSEQHPLNTYPVLQAYVKALYSIVEGLGTPPILYQNKDLRANYDPVGIGPPVQVIATFALAGAGILATGTKLLAVRGKEEEFDLYASLYWLGGAYFVMKAGRITDTKLDAISRQLTTMLQPEFQAICAKHNVQGRAWAECALELQQDANVKLVKKLREKQKSSLSTQEAIDERAEQREAIIQSLSAPAEVKAELRKMVENKTFDAFVGHITTPTNKEAQQSLAYAILINANPRTLDAFIKQQQQRQRQGGVPPHVI